MSIILTANKGFGIVIIERMRGFRYIARDHTEPTAEQGEKPEPVAADFPHQLTVGQGRTGRGFYSRFRGYPAGLRWKRAVPENLHC